MMEDYMDDQIARESNIDTIERQNKAVEESIKSSNILKTSFLKLKEDLDKFDDVSKTQDIILSLNESLERLEKTTNNISRVYQSNISDIEKAKSMRGDLNITTEEFDKLSIDERKEVLEKKNFDASLRDKVGKTADTASAGNMSLRLANIEMSKLHQRFEELKSEEDPKKKKSEEENKDKTKDDNFKKRDKIPKWVTFLGKSIYSGSSAIVKTALFPFTMVFKSITGILSGIWNSSLMGMAKVVALIGGLVWAFDWIKVLLNTWKNEMTDNYNKFMGEAGIWGTAMENAVKFSEAIKEFINPNYESEFLSQTNSKWENIFYTLGNTLWEVIKAGMDELMRGIWNFVTGSEYTQEQWKNRGIESDARNIDLSKLTPSNALDYNTAMDFKSQQETANLTSLMINPDGSVNHLTSLDSYSDKEKYELVSSMSNKLLLDHGIEFDKNNKREVADVYNNPEYAPIIEDYLGQVIESINNYKLKIESSGEEFNGRKLKGYMKRYGASKVKMGEELNDITVKEYDEILSDMGTLPSDSSQYVYNRANENTRHVRDTYSKHDLKKLESLVPTSDNIKSLPNIRYQDTESQKSVGFLGEYSSKVFQQNAEMIKELKRMGDKLESSHGSTIINNTSQSKNQFMGNEPTGALSAYSINNHKGVRTA